VGGRAPVRNPLGGGTVGLVVATGGEGTNAIEARFDDLAVRRA
jgi:hypothetical protein